MKKYRKLLGVMIAQPDAYYSSALIQGILTQAFKFDYDVAVFSPFIKDKLSDLWHVGERNIFNFVNYSLLDGIIFVPDTLKVEDIDKQVENDIKTKFKGPVVSVDIETEGFANIFTDDVHNVKKIVSHLIEEHNLTDIAFMTGFKGHPHATNRLTGYYEALVEHGLPIDQSRVFYGDFWYDEGERVVQELIDSGRPLPQAIACGSDTMAISVCEALKKRNIRVPEDVAVTGYDTISAGINYVPSITSANVPADITGIRAVKLLHSLMTDTAFVDEPCEPKINVAKSCGCSINVAENMRNEQCVWKDEDYYFNFDSAYNFMLESLISCKDYEAYIYTLGWYTHMLGSFDHFYLCLCENWDNLGETEQNPNYLKCGYTQKVYMPLHKHDDYSHVDFNLKFSTSIMLPAIYEKRSYPTAFFFTPVHFNDRCFGYSVINFGDKPVSYSDTYRKWMRYVCNSIESLRRQRNLQCMYKKMEENAVTDLLTGIYNRNGFNLYAENIFNQAKQNNQKFTVILGDMNNLKYINDCYGHGEGDFAIKSVANAFKEICGPHVQCFRIGGDEFVLISRAIITKGEIDEIMNEISAYLKRVNDTDNKPYSISVSLGSFFGSTDEVESVEHAVTEADSKMFAAKEKYKREEGFDYRKTRSAM